MIEISENLSQPKHFEFIEFLNITNRKRNCSKDNDPTELGIRINISTHMEQVFKLRLSLQSCPFDPKKLGKVKREFFPGQMEIVSIS